MAVRACSLDDPYPLITSVARFGDVRTVVILCHRFYPSFLLVMLYQGWRGSVSPPLRYLADTRTATYSCAVVL